MPEPHSTLPPTATTKGTVAADLMPAPQCGVHHQCQVSKSPSCEIKKVWLDDSSSSGATLSLFGDSSTSFRSLAPTPFHVPQFTSMPGKAMMEARVHSLSWDSDSLAGPHDQMEVFPMDFRWSLPPTTPIPSMSESQPVGSSVYAPPFPLTIGAGGTITQAEELYMLTSKCRLLSIGLACGFCQLSGEEAVSRLQALAAAQEILHKPQGDASNAWEESYAPLLAHVTKFDAKLGTYLGYANKDRDLDVHPSHGNSVVHDSQCVSRVRIIPARPTPGDFTSIILPAGYPFQFGTWTRDHHLPEEGWHLLLHSSGTGQFRGH